MALGQAVASIYRQNKFGSTLSTPNFLWRWLLGLVTLFALTGVSSVAAGLALQEAADSLAHSTGPALVEVQALSSSLAEANAEATASFLATSLGTQDPATDTSDEESSTEEPGGGEVESSEASSAPALDEGADRLHHKRYLAALGRAGVQGEKASASVGDDEFLHGELQEISTAVTFYNGDIHAARIANSNGIPGAEDRMLDALATMEQTIAPKVEAVNSELENDLSRRSSEGSREVGLAAAICLAALVALIVGQISLAKRTRRVFSPFLVVATVCVVANFAVLSIAGVGRHGSTADATNGGYDSISGVAGIQSNLSQAQLALGLQLLGASPDADLDLLLQQTEDRIDTVREAADSEPERAEVERLDASWQTYRLEVQAIGELLASDDEAGANARFESSGVSASADLKATLDEVLADNRYQFLDGLDQAASATTDLSLLGIVLPFLAAALTFLGIQRRQEDYR